MTMTTMEVPTTYRHPFMGVAVCRLRAPQSDRRKNINIIQKVTNEVCRTRGGGGRNIKYNHPNASKIVNRPVLRV